MKSGNDCYQSTQYLMFSSLISKNIHIKIQYLYKYTEELRIQFKSNNIEWY
jgi:hypothetical protein